MDVDFEVMLSGFEFQSVLSMTFIPSGGQMLGTNYPPVSLVPFSLSHLLTFFICEADTKDFPLLLCAPVTVFRRSQADLERWVLSGDLIVWQVSFCNLDRSLSWALYIRFWCAVGF